MQKAHARSSNRWSQHVTETSHALDLQEGVFRLSNPTQVARSLKRSAERSRARKATPFQSAMSMLNFYTKAKSELRRLFGKSDS
jgi:hypothetical protein